MENIISSREAAYKIYQTTSLRKLLANNYTRLGKYYYQVEEIYNANRCFLEAIKYECAYLEMLKTDDDEYYKHLYRIGMIFHLIADMKGADLSYRIQSLILSSCLLDIASSNISYNSNGAYYFYSTYYNGMVNHKLAILLCDDSDSCIYIKSACVNYINSTKAQDYKKQKIQQYKYIKQMGYYGKRI